MQEQEAPLLGDSGKRPSTPPLDSRELTVDEGLDLVGFGRWQYGLLTIVGFSVVSGAVETSLLSYLTLCVADEWDLNYAQLTTFTSVVYVGMVLGSIGAGPFADAHGRRATILGFLQARRADLAPPRAREHPGNVDAIRRSLITATPTSVDASARRLRSTHTLFLPAADGIVRHAHRGEPRLHHAGRVPLLCRSRARRAARAARSARRGARRPPAALLAE